MGTSLQALLQELQRTPEGAASLAARRRGLFLQIHEIVFYGKGGYDFDTVYNLPIWLRNFIYHEIVEAYRAEAESAEGRQAKKSEKPQMNEAVVQTLRRQSNFSIKKPGL